MKRAPIKKGAVWFAFVMICLSVFGQEGKFQAPTWEARVNQRQPPELVLKIYEDAGYVLAREEAFLPKDNIYFLKKRPA